MLKPSLADTVSSDLTSAPDMPGSVRRQPRPPWLFFRRLRHTAIGACLPIGILLVWQVLASAGKVDLRLFPAPSEVFWDLIELTQSGVLFSSFMVSLGRAMAGLALGASLGLICGLLVGSSRLFETVLDPTVQMLRTISLLAVTPLFIIWLGFSEQAKIVLIATGAFFPMYVNAFLGVRSVDAKLIEVTRVLEFTRAERILKLVLPAAAPNILVGLRLAVGMSWLCLVVAELMGAQSGLGYLIQDARSLLDTPTVLVGIAAFAAIGKTSDSLVRLLERRFLGWRNG